VDTLEPGVDYVDSIHSAVAGADALLVVIGRGWTSAKNLEGARRLDDPGDFVRLEVAMALNGEPVVIPVLVGGAAMPDEEDLPSDLVLLARRNALTMIDADWHSGMARLTAALRRILEPVEEPTELVDVTPEGTAEVVVEEEREDETGPALVPVLATALALAGVAGLAIGTFLQVDHWAHPSAGPADRDGLGFFSSLAPMGLLVGAIGSLGLSYTRGAARVGTGLFLGFALAGVARYASLLGAWGSTAREEPSGWRTGAALALISCAALAAAAVLRLRADPAARLGPPGWLPVALALGGAALVVVGTIAPFNDGPQPTRTGQTAIIDRDGGWWAVETVGCALLAIGAAFFLGRRRAAASAALIALGTYLVLLFAGRYIGYPAWQPDTISSIAWGGFLGVAGGAAILIAGVAAGRRGAPEEVARSWR
jgi:hypothetical protein